MAKLTPPPPPKNRNFKSRTIYHCDNLPVLRGMNSGTVDLIATDPPFNKGKDFHATPDSLAAGESFQDRWSWERDVHEEWVDRLQNDWPRVYFVINSTRRSYGDDMAAYLCFMAVRLIEMRRVLKTEGSIYLHCDQTASHYLKQLMDSIFGRKCFANEIVWCYAPSGRGPKYGFHRKHDVLLYYRKTDTTTFNRPYGEMTEKTRRTYSLVEEDTGRIYKMSPGGRSYLDQQKGRPIPSWWTDIPSFGSATNSPERTGYPTQKPLALYERVIKASSNDGDLILDPFAGCATTCVAAERCDRQWIGVDIWNEAHGVVLGRLEREGLLGPEGGALPYRGEIHYVTEPPDRTDGGEEPVPFLEVRTVEFPVEPEPAMTRREMVAELLERYGQVCRGCDRAFDDYRYLQLDHNTPRSQGGLNHISNRMLLCGPCNGIKSDQYTLKGLRSRNRKLGRMVRRS